MSPQRSACRTTVEHDVWVAYRRHLRRKGATVFGCIGSALAEALKEGAQLSPDFVERFSCGTRILDETGIHLTPHGRAILANENSFGVELPVSTGETP